MTITMPRTPAPRFASDEMRPSPFVRLRDGIVTELVTGRTYALGDVAADLLARSERGLARDGLTRAETAIAQELERNLILLTPSSLAAIRRATFATVDVEIAGTCNAACVFCPREALTQGRGVGIMRRHMFLKIFERLADSVETLAFCGIGEPTLNRHLPEFIGLAKSHGKRVVLVTNGSLLTDDLSESLIASGVDHIQISFTGMSKQSYEEHMLNLDYDRVRRNVERLLERATGRVPVSLSAVRTTRNADDLRGYVEHWRSLGATAAVVGCHSRGDSVKDPKLGATGRVLPAPGDAQRCGLFNSRSFITWQGDVLACCHDISGATRLGNLVDDSWEAVADRKIAVIAEQKWWPLCRGCDEPLAATHLEPSTILRERP